MLFRVIAPPAPRRDRRALTVVLLAAGLALLAWQIQRIGGLATIRVGFSAVGWWFLVVLALSLGRFALRSFAWTTLANARVPLAASTSATIVGDALGNVTPLGLIASEPAKAWYLSDRLPAAHGLAALVAENFFYSVSVAIYVVIAAAAMLAFFTLPVAVQWAGVAALTGMALVLAGSAWLAWQKPAVASGLLKRVPIARLQHLVDRLRAFEIESYGSAGHAGGRLAVVAACELLFHALSLVECWLIYRCLTGDASILPPLVFDGLNRVINIVGRPIPLRIGVEEYSTGLFATAIGVGGPVGVTLALVRKVRVIVWAIIGFGIYAVRRR